MTESGTTAGTAADEEDELGGEEYNEQAEDDDKEEDEDDDGEGGGGGTNSDPNPNLFKVLPLPSFMAESGTTAGTAADEEDDDGSEEDNEEEDEEEEDEDDDSERGGGGTNRNLGIAFTLSKVSLSLPLRSFAFTSTLFSVSPCILDFPSTPTLVATASGSPVTLSTTLGCHPSCLNEDDDDRGDEGDESESGIS
ncbi:hypothetical protein AGMMS50222_11040 [Endomicrobiia bacterium]|nr:hypothetical protein AGMMS50222_11040 [Endomicrobiia bacterium]